MLTKLRLELLASSLSGSQLAARIGVNQSSVSRCLQQNSELILKVGEGRSSRYCYYRNISGRHHWPIYRVNAVGQAESMADLYSVYPSGYEVFNRQSQSWAHYDGLPWWMFDMRPQGFLGRSIAKIMAARFPGLALNPTNWSEEDSLQVLNCLSDAVGNLLVGNAYEDWVKMTPEVVTDPQLPSLALRAMQGEVAGSSAGGEQPKFICTLNEPGNHVIVKFSPPIAPYSAISERIADLLRAEHHALETLREYHISAAYSRLLTAGGDTEPQRQFLVVKRFDRDINGARHGVVSLRALDAQFVGSNSQHWPSITAELMKKKVITKDAHLDACKLWAFGRLIGNSDLHFGNLSFMNNGELPLSLAPCYDMLPMRFAPLHGSEIVDHDFTPDIIPVVDKAIWSWAMPVFYRFWSRLAADLDISESFRDIAKSILSKTNEVQAQINRLA